MPRQRHIVKDPSQLVTEADWQAQVEALLKANGWRYYHTHDSRHSVAGFPDLIAIQEEQRRLVALELKSERGRTSAEQDAWLDALESVGVEVYVCYPSGLAKLAKLLG